jgi:hypothetical protein
MDAKKLKSFVKGVAAKETFGTNPLDPWSTKANIAESASLEKYLLSKGINPKSLSMATKVAHAKSSAFMVWQKNHMNEEHDSVKKPLKKESDTSVKGNQNSNPVHNEEVQIDEGKMGELSADIGQHIDKHIANYKARGGAEHLMSKIDDTAKKIASSHKMEHEHAHKFVSDYVEGKLHESAEQIDELKKSTLASYVKGAIADRELSATGASFRSGKAGDEYNKADETPKEIKRGKGIETALSKLTKEDVKEETVNEVSSELLDRYKTGAKKSAAAATANGQHGKALKRWTGHMKATGKQIEKTTAGIRKALNKEELSYSARIIKEILNKVVKEDLYDHEKEDKSVASYGKKPNHDKADDKDSKGENKPKAAAVLSGGTTLTGSPRDTVEIDPMMRVRPGQPDPTKKEDKKDDKKDDKKKDK